MCAATNRWRRDLRSVAVCLALVLAGRCSVDAGLTVNVDPGNYCSEIAEIACHNLFACCTGKVILEQLGETSAASESACRADVELRCQEQNAGLLFALQAETATLDADNATACLEARLLPEGDCFPMLVEAPWAAPCAEQQAQGLLQSGAACALDLECAPGLVCAADRKCVLLPLESAPCAAWNPSRPCGNGLYCGAEGTCRSLGRAGVECAFDRPCGPGLFCGETKWGEPYVCKPLKADGEPCSGDSQCDSDFCVPGLCNDGASCWGENDCTGICLDDSGGCAEAADCPGTCFASAGPCATDTDCPQGESCTHVPCQRDCIGGQVCGHTLHTVSYCQAALDLL